MNSDIKVWYRRDYKPGMDLGPPDAILPAPSYVPIQPGSTIKQDAPPEPKRVVEQANQKKPRRKYPIEIIKLSEDNGIEYQTFLDRVRRGWAVEDAATIPPMSVRERGAIGGKNSVESRRNKAK